MYEDYYTPVPDIQIVLSRIQFDETAFPPDLAHLEKLIYAFQTHIPFEDLDSSWLNQPLRLDIPSLYEKLRISDMNVIPYSAGLYAAGIFFLPARTAASLST